ncbi:MAG TPA: ectonucleotide pyrophosphatase/phosphodiesterase, partial [Gemmatirosa sp.]
MNDSGWMFGARRVGRAAVRRLAGAVALLAACRLPAPAPPAPLPPATVVLVSFDGFRADYLDRRLPLPAFARLEAAGVRARALVPSFPSKTFPNHWTLVTGLRPGHHGIVANAFWDPVRQGEYRIRDTAAVRDASWYGGTPVWALAERAGIRTGTVFWPGSEAAVGGVRPSHWLRYASALPDSARVDTVAAWLALPAAARPRFVALYVSVADDSGHAAGPDAPATDSAIVEADRTLGRLLDRLDAMPGGNDVNVVVVSDHG